ncbi:MAG: tetratricopeptide repeat protein [Flavobacteriaceae bacterium]|nr:tetratricopeptide repeat protein [Flavobacteriaceae bacterium]
MKYLIYILLLITSFGYAQNEQLFEKANGLYNSEKYNEAVQVYQQLLSTKNHSVSLYFNLGNAHYKLNQLAESVYYYEKALQLDPANEDVLTNLTFANNMRIDKIDLIPTTGFSKMFSSIVNMLSFDTWAILGVVFMMFFIVSFVGYSQSKFTNRKRFFFIVSLFSLFLSVLSVAFAYQQEATTINEKYAIVFAKESQVKSEPKFNSDEAFQLHEGTKVSVFEDFEGWTKIKLTNGSVGWIISKDVKRL